MFKNYIKIALRNIKRYKAYSFINISGLALGMACCLFITLWVIDELGYDRFHKDADQIYQVVGNGKLSSTPIPLSPAMKEIFPEVVYASRYEHIGEQLIRRGENVFYENGIRAVDEDFFNIFSFPFVKGDPQSVLKDMNSIVISEELAQKLFPDEDPFGQIITMNDERDFTVTGVMNNITINSTLDFNAAVSYAIPIAAARRNGQNPDSWGWWRPETYVKLGERAGVDDLNRKMTAYYQQQVKEDDNFSFLPISERRFFFWDTKKYITIFSVIAAFILLVACINFINLSSAHSATRAPEIGIRKVIGAYRKNLFFQFMGESFFTTLFAVFISFALLFILLPYFNNMTGKHFGIQHLTQPLILVVSVGLMLITGLVSGSYPALILSSFKPVRVLRNQVKAGPAGYFFRKILVIVQFSISIFLLIATGVIYTQLDYIKSSDIGYAKEQLLSIGLKGESKKSYNLLKDRLQSNPSIQGITGICDDLPYFNWTDATSEWSGKDPNKEIHLAFNLVDYDFVKTLGLKLIAGRDFSKQFPADIGTGIIVNEQAVKLMGLESVVGQPFSVWGKPGKIVGVVKNAHFQPLTNRILPVFFQLKPDFVNHLVLRIPTENISGTIKSVEKTWHEIFPLYPFEYRFVNDDFNRSYRYFSRINQLGNIFTVMAVFISCLGLLGLASFTTKQRSKEIGVRKVLGASVTRILVILVRDYSKWVLAANIVAWPVAWFVMIKWLQNFEYRIDPGWWIFVLSGLLALLVAMLTVSIQVLSAALTDPVEALRYE